MQIPNECQSRWQSHVNHQMSKISPLHVLQKLGVNHWWITMNYDEEVKIFFGLHQSSSWVHLGTTKSMQNGTISGLHPGEMNYDWGASLGSHGTICSLKEEHTPTFGSVSQWSEGGILPPLWWRCEVARFIRNVNSYKCLTHSYGGIDYIFAPLEVASSQSLAYVWAKQPIYNFPGFWYW